MTVSSSTNVVILSADGSTHSFSFTFKIFAASDLKVIVRSAAGVETEKTLDSHYIIPTSSVGNTSGGNILFKFNTGTSSDAHYSTTDFRPANGEKVILRRQQPQTQELDLVDNDPFSATLIEEQFDKVVMQIQGVQEAVDRSLKFSRSNLLDSSGSQIGSTYPEIEEDTTARANKVLSFDSTGTPIATQEIGTLRGDWAADTAYQERDIVKDTSTSDHFIVNTAHTSSGSQPLTTNTNSAKYTAITNFASSIITGTITASAINTTTSGTDNLIAGQDAGDSIQSGGQYNVLLGHDAGTAITTGDYNVAVGNEALKTETNTNMTVAVGHKALAAQINGSSDNNVFNTAVGARAGEAVTTASVNTLIGGVAGKKLTVGSYNVAIGYGALENEQFTHFNTAVGYQALNTLDFTNSEAAALGYLANNTALGNGAGYSLDNGNMNTFLGVTAGYHITSGNKNTIVGTYNGNEGGLDIRTSSNYVVLSDGDGNPRLYFTDTGVANFASNVSINGTVTATGFIIGSANINENDLEAIDGITAGTVAASKVVTVDTNKDITGFRNVTLTGELDAGSLDISGDADIAGTTNLDDTDIDGTLVVDGSNISLDSTSTLNIDNSNTSNGITIGTATSGVPVSIGHSTSEVTINDNLNVTGDLTVNGTTTTVNSTVTTVVDPILTIGSNSTDDNKDRGLEFKYNDGSARVGFFGYDDSASAFTVFTAATNSSEVFSGTTGNAIFNQVTGTLQTAAQTNITSVGTLSSLTVSGLVTADGGIDVDDFHIDGTAISLSAGNLSIDAGDNILLNTKQSSGSGGAVYLKQGGTNYGGLLNSSGELVIQSGSSPTTAVTFSGANATFAGTVASTGVLTANAGVKVDNITIDGTEIDLSSGDLTIDVAGDLTLDVGGGDILLKDDGALVGTIGGFASNNVVIKNEVSNGDVIIQGNDSDGGGGITALTLDMSEAGAATFNSTVTASTMTLSRSSSNSPNVEPVLLFDNIDSVIAANENIGSIRFTTSAEGSGGDAQLESGRIACFSESGHGSATNASALAFYTASSEAASSNERMRIDSSGNVGLSATPLALRSDQIGLQIGGNFSIMADSGTAASNSFNLSQNAHFDGAWKYISDALASNYYQSAGQHNFRVAASGTGGNTVSWTTAMTIGSSGQVAIDTDTFYVDAANNRVGIGSTNPHAILDVKPATDGRILFVNNSGDPDIVAVNNANSAYANLKLEGATVQFRIAGGDKGQFDSSGTLLVGRTADGDSTAGAMIRGSGFIQSTRDGNLAADFNRLSSDGDIVRFQRASTPVGTISVANSGGNFLVKSVGDAYLTTSTSDGSDDHFAALDGGNGAGSTSRGAFIGAYGNEHSSFGGDALVMTGASGAVKFLTGSNADECMRIESTGHVVVNRQDSTTGKFEVHVNATDTIPTGTLIQTADNNVGLRVWNNNNSANYSAIKLETRTSAASGWLIANEWKGSYYGDLVFRGRNGASTSAEQMRIAADGTVTILNATTTNRLNSYDTFRATNTGRLNLEPHGNLTISFGGDSDSSYYAAIFANNSSSSVGYILVGSSATDFGTSSDYRLKENVNYDWDATSRLKQLKPARFNFKTEPDKTIDGLIAHEVSEIVPNAVSGEKDEMKNGEPFYQGIDHSKLVPLLTKSLQEAMARIETLEAKVAKLEGG